MELLELKKLHEELALYFGNPIQEGALKPIQTGFSNAHNYRFQNEGKQYFVRMFPRDQTEPQRKQEIDASELAAQNGIAPLNYHIATDNTWMISDFVTAKHMGWSDYQDWETLRKLVERLKQLHSLSGLHLSQAPTSLQRYRNYLKTALGKKATLPGQLLKLENQLLSLEHPPELSCFIHNDLNPYNILIKNEQIHFIDWAEAGLGEPCSDLVEIAIFLEENAHGDFLELYRLDIKKKDINRLKRHYLQRLGLFAAWGYSQAAEITSELTPDDWQASLETPMMPIRELLQRILEKDLHLDGTQNFIHFSAICYQNALEYLRNHF